MKAKIKARRCKIQGIIFIFKCCKYNFREMLDMIKMKTEQFYKN